MTTGGLRALVALLVVAFVVSSMPLAVERSARTGEWPSAIGLALAATTPTLSTFALQTGPIGIRPISPPHGGQIGDTQLTVIVLRDDSSPGQAIVSVTDDRTGEAWTRAGVVPLTNGLIVGAYWHRLTVSGLDSHTYNLAVPAGRGNYVVWVFRVHNAGDFDAATAFSTQLGASTTVQQPDFTPAADGELIISVAGFLSDLPATLSRPSGSNPPFAPSSSQFPSSAGQLGFPGSAVHQGGPGVAGQPIGPRTLTATSVIARASVLVIGVKPQGPPPDFGTAFAYTFGAGIHSGFSRDPVNLGTGSLTVQAQDLALPGRVLGFSFDRWYNSADPTSGPLGPGWTHSYNWSLADAGGTVEVRRGDGRRDLFSRNADGTYSGPPSVFDRLTKEPDGSYALLLTSQVRYRFSSSGRLLSVAEPAGNQVALAYTGSDLTAIADTVGRVVALSYDAQNRLVRLQDPLGRATTYAYDAAGRLVTVTDRIGNGAGPASAHQWRYGYDASTRHIRTITDPDGRARVTNVYDAQGRVVEQRDALGARTTMAYSSGQTVVTDPRGHQTTYAFDSRLRVLSQTDPVGAAPLTVSYTYDAAGNRTSVTDRRGKRTDFSYDSRGNLVTKTDPSPDGVSPRPVTSFSYDSKNNLTRITDAAGFTTDLSYDPATNALLSVARQIDAFSSAKTTYEYRDGANPGLPTRITSPRGNLGAAPDPAFSTDLVYDAQANLVRRADPDGVVTTFDYDALGRLVSFVDPDGNAPAAVPADHTWRVTYDELDRETSRTDPLGGVLRYAYDGAGNRTSLTDRGGNVISYAYDANARLATVEQRPDPVASPATVYTTSVARDASGNATRITQANGVATDYAFDELDRLVSVTTRPTPTTPLTTSYVLDGNGQPTSRTTGDGVTVGYTYDDLSRLVSVSGPALSISYAYDAVGRRTRMTDATGVSTYQYDGLGRPRQVAAPAGTLTYAYDPDGNRTRLVYPGGDTVSYAYSAGGRLTSLADWAGRTSTYTYQASGLVSSLRFPNAMTATYEYDRAQRLTALAYSRHAIVVAQDLMLDAEGNRTAISERVQRMPPINAALRYDGLNRLVSFDRHVANGVEVSSEAFTLDPATNLTTRTGPAATYTYDGANRLTSDGTRAFVWDGADRLVARGADAFTYDALSRLVSSAVAGTTRTYAYDGDGLLRSRTQGAVSTGFVWDTTVAPAPLLVAGTDRIVHGLGPLYAAHQDGTYDTYARDALGSVRAEVSGTGRLTNTFDYAAYGALRASLAGAPRLLGFTGELADPSGLVYLRARWYDTAVGRFMTRDLFAGSTRLPTSLNGFTYVGARPTVLVDPLGLYPARANWAYAVADVFADLDSADPFRRTTAQIIVGASGFAIAGLLVAGFAAFGPTAAASTTPALPVVQKIAVIGENQQRVIARARELGGAATMPDVQSGHHVRLARTRDWIQGIMDEGYVIHNVGRDPRRIESGTPISEFFQAELQEVVARGYTRIIPGAWPVVP